MFLDEKLYQHTMKYVIAEPNDFRALINELYKLSEDNWKPQCYEGMSKKEIKTIIDRVFRSWELFIAKLKKEKWFLVDMLEKYSYRVTFMQDEELKEIYEKL